MRKTILAILVLYSLFLLTVILYQIVQKENPPFANNSSVAENIGKKTLRIEGLDISNYLLSTFESSIKIDYLEIRPRKFSIFRIKSLNELYLSNVLIQTRTTSETNTDDNGTTSLGGHLFKSFDDFGELIEFGNVQRIIFTNLEYRILLGETKLVEQIVKADQAIYDVRKQVMTMKKANVELFSPHRLLTAPELEWNDKRQQWFVTKHANLTVNGITLVIEQQVLDKELKRVN